jgi:hypothetical protein
MLASFQLLTRLLTLASLMLFAGVSAIADVFAAVVTGVSSVPCVPALMLDGPAFVISHATLLLLAFLLFLASMLLLDCC